MNGAKMLSDHGYTYMKGRDRARMLTRIRDNFTCQDCGEVRTPEQVKQHNDDIRRSYPPGPGQKLRGLLKLFDVHHIDGRCGKNSHGYDRIADVPGLITLCHKCHYNRPEHAQRLRDAEARDAANIPS